jgi:hypothetical protein
VSLNLDSIKVLFRAPDTLALYGVPYRMRPGQQPGDLWRAHRDYPVIPGSLGPAYPGYGSRQIDLSDWIWLGQPGSWGSITSADQEAITAWLDSLGPVVPEGPYEWSDLTEDWT